MVVLYSIKEGLGGFRRARLSSFVSVSIVAISLTLVGLFLVATVNMGRLIRAIQKRMSFEVFIDSSLDDQGIAQLEEEIRGLQGIGAVEFVSKEKAAQTFQQEFGEDIFEILDENPLPSSFRIDLADDSRSAETADLLAEQLRGLKGVDEVVYRAELFRLLDRYIEIVVVVDLSIGLLLLLGSLFVISNTIRLIIHAKRDSIVTMKLVGATASFIRRPFLVEGMIQGILGGCVASILLFFAVRLTGIEMRGLILVEKDIYGSLVLAGLVFGWLGSLIAVRRYLRY